ncbi:hypothetical protein IJ076_01235 [Candidatus Saccharibacteria bacterium]|nr:hypothetical protein [Candidatus Saccharibacteria bacterium]
MKSEETHPTQTKITAEKPEVTDTNEKATAEKKPATSKSAPSKNKFNTKLIAIIAAAVVAVIVIIVVVMNITKPSFEEYDLKGLTIKEACEKARKAGWRVSSVTSRDYSDKTDCYNTDKTVTDYDYFNFNKTVDIYFGEKKEQPKEEPEEEPEKEPKEEKKEEQSAPSTPATPSTPAPSASSSSTNWRQLLKEYEAWVDKYIDFMARYKNATDTTSKLNMLSEYNSLLTEMTEWSEKVDKEKSDLSGSDLTEYLQTITRISQKISQIQY